MRITGGIHRGKGLKAPPGLSTRPTSDRARQAIFNILNHAGWRTRNLIEDAAIMDVFAGTGALGLEALSQGAGHGVFIENDSAAQTYLRQNIDTMKLQDSTRLFKMDALRPSPRPSDLAPRSLVFLDPPYAKNLGTAAITALTAANWLTDDAVVVLEMAKKDPEPALDGFTLEDERTYGVALVRFLSRKN